MRLPRVIRDNNVEPIRRKLEDMAIDLPAWRKAHADKSHWINTPVKLEFPGGETCEAEIKTLALLGPAGQYEYANITEDDRFDAQGLEGKIVVRRPLFVAIALIRLFKPHRWQIVVREKK